MNDEYLWSGRGRPDPEVERLENVLSRLRLDRPAPELPALGAPARSRVWAPVAALLALASLSGWMSTRGVAPGWQVARLEGTPAVASRPIARSARLEIGQSLETDAAAKARLDIGNIGVVEIEPNSRLRLVSTRPSEHRLALDRGIIHAVIWAPPRRFFVDTPSAVAVDLGCAYTLEVDERGGGLIHVNSGWVSFERDGRESFIPAGAECRTRPGIGPGTPYQEDAPETFRHALERLDFAGGGRDALETVLREAREDDAFTLWHLLLRVPREERGKVYDRLAVLLPPPDGVTREGVLLADRAMLDRWWDSLGLGDADWWRMWKGDWPLAAR